MQPFNVAQALAGRSMQDAMETLSSAHYKEVQNLRNRVDELMHSLSKIQSIALPNKSDEAELAEVSRGVKEMKDLFSLNMEDSRESTNTLNEIGQRDYFQPSEIKFIVQPSVSVIKDPPMHGFEGEVPMRRSTPSECQHGLISDPTPTARCSTRTSCRTLTPAEVSEAAKEARQIRQQVLDLLPPAQRRLKKMVFGVNGEASTDKRSLRRIVEHPVFESICAVMIILNSFLVGFDVEWYTQHDVPDEGMEIAGHVCSLFFLIELIVRLRAYKLAFFRGESMLWNMFDLVLVIMSIVEVLLSHVDDNAGAATIGSGMKTLKMLRIVRVFRVFRFFKELSLLALMIIDSMKALVWALVMLAIILYVFAICFTVNATEYIKTDNPYDQAQASEVFRMFGSIPRTTYTLLQAMLGGISWGVCSDALHHVGRPLTWLFFFYISFTMLAVLNIITGVFVDNAVETAKTQRDFLVQKEFELKERYLQEMRDLFNDMDDDGSGTITLEEIKEYFVDPRVMSYFQALGLDPNDTERLFRLIDDDGSGDVSIEEFLHGCMRLKGGARSIDVHQLLLECRKIEHKFEKIESDMGVLSSKAYRKQATPLVVHSY